MFLLLKPYQPRLGVFDGLTVFLHFRTRWAWWRVWSWSTAPPWPSTCLVIWTVRRAASWLDYRPRQRYTGSSTVRYCPCGRVINKACAPHLRWYKVIDSLSVVLLTWVEFHSLLTVFTQTQETQQIKNRAAMLVYETIEGDQCSIVESTPTWWPWRHVKTLHNNVHVMYQFRDNLLRDTPLEKWYGSGELGGGGSPKGNRLEKIFLHEVNT